MRKTHYRDYATEAFRLYARVGSKDKYEQQIRNEATEKQTKREERIIRGDDISCPTEAAIIRAEKAVEEAFATIADLDAVEFALNVLEYDKIQAVKMVYMAEPERELERGDIRDRVHWASLRIPASERSIYGWLAEAREIFAEKRGLRIS